MGKKKQIEVHQLSDNDTIRKVLREANAPLTVEQITSRVDNRRLTRAKISKILCYLKAEPEQQAFSSTWLDCNKPVWRDPSVPLPLGHTDHARERASILVPEDVEKAKALRIAASNESSQKAPPWTPSRLVPIQPLIAPVAQPDVAIAIKVEGDTVWFSALQARIAYQRLKEIFG